MGNSGVYVLEAVGTDRFKIGWSTDIEKRINSIKTGCPYPTKLVCVIVSEDCKIERQIHELFSDCRVHGEWFVIEDSGIEFLCNATEADILSVNIAQFILSKDLSVFFDESKVESIRLNMQEAFDDLWR